MAKNLLIEEFPSAKEFIKPHKGDDNIWYFDTDVYQIEGLARFYIGLANHIKILNAPELEKFIASFVKETTCKNKVNGFFWNYDIVCNFAKLPTTND